MKIIVINGQGGVGKDTFVAFCGNEDHGIFNFSMVDEIKRVAKILHWTGSKEPKDRKFLSDLKDLASEYNDFPFQHTINKIKDALRVYGRFGRSTHNMVCFVHAREPEDINRWVNDYGARALLIRNERIEGEYGNHADDSVMKASYYYTVYNNEGLYELEQKAKKFIDEVRKEEWESNIYAT